MRLQFLLPNTRLTGDFIRLYYNISDISLKNIDHKLINDFEAYLIANYQLTHNTITKYLKKFKAYYLHCDG
ncbi:MAG: phage integrase SAM-like domain-containing protein [Dysgonamonadaceae bacterium]|nr:phage integrase SAM-like domain-containing protein [Dysgonamonadaceae bacterium]